jgi:hypothetical protein
MIVFNPKAIFDIACLLISAIQILAGIVELTLHSKTLDDSFL